MAARSSPTVRLRRLSRELERLHRESDLSEPEILRRSGWSKTKLWRAHSLAWRQPVVEDVARLLDAYGLTDDGHAAERAALLRLAREARRRGWWADYRVREDYSTYIGLEAEASMMRNWEPMLVPGLLQTAGYARAVITAQCPHLSDWQVEERVELRMERQEALLSGADPLRLWAIMSEGALCRMVGGRAVMAEQLDHLHKVAQAPNVDLQVLSFEAGAGPASNPFVILTFVHDLDPETIYIETSAGDLFVEGAGADPYKVHFEALIEAAVSAPDTLTLIADKANRLRETAGG